MTPTILKIILIPRNTVSEISLPNINPWIPPTTKKKCVKPSFSLEKILTSPIIRSIGSLQEELQAICRVRHPADGPADRRTVKEDDVAQQCVHPVLPWNRADAHLKPMVKILERYLNSDTRVQLSRRLASVTSRLCRRSAAHCRALDYIIYSQRTLFSISETECWILTHYYLARISKVWTINL